MNWTNYDRLVDYLKQLPPERFHYGHTAMPNGCLACHCGILAGSAFSTSHNISGFLGIPYGEEARYLFGFTASFDPDAPGFVGPHPEVFYKFFGEMGIAEALRRLAVVAGRHQRPPVEAPTPTPEQEAAFLAICRQISRNPVESAQ